MIPQGIFKFQKLVLSILDSHFQLISQVSASEGDEQELLVQGLCAFLLGICVLFNQDQVENSHR